LFEELMRQLSELAEETADSMRSDEDFQRSVRRAITGIRQSLLQIEAWLDRGRET
jgi:hypothetical protein